MSSQDTFQQDEPYKSHHKPQKSRAHSTVSSASSRSSFGQSIPGKISNSFKFKSPRSSFSSLGIGQSGGTGSTSTISNGVYNEPSYPATSESVIDSMEKEQEGIVLKLMREIQDLKEENNFLKQELNLVNWHAQGFTNGRSRASSFSGSSLKSNFSTSYMQNLSKVGATKSLNVDKNLPYSESKVPLNRNNSLLSKRRATLSDASIRRVPAFINNQNQSKSRSRSRSGSISGDFNTLILGNSGNVGWRGSFSPFGLSTVDDCWKDVDLSSRRSRQRENSNSSTSFSFQNTNFQETGKLSNAKNSDKTVAMFDDLPLKLMENKKLDTQNNKNKTLCEGTIKNDNGISCSDGHGGASKNAMDKKGDKYLVNDYKEIGKVQVGNDLDAGNESFCPDISPRCSTAGFKPLT
ncbi:hypothetical protein DAMA08_045900 [Martiniozyma asiatica (nom. inval.)]|nr:hypothetical protein DAMA08_045900 [Martiniozyma asiatica]